MFPKLMNCVKAVSYTHLDVYKRQAGAVNGIGTQIVDGLRTDTRNMTAAAALLTQPLYMGGKIRAYDRITRYSEQVAEQGLRAEEQEVVLEADQAYWQVVSLSNKQRLAVDVYKRQAFVLPLVVPQALNVAMPEMSMIGKMNFFI